MRKKEKTKPSFLTIHQTQINLQGRDVNIFDIFEIFDIFDG